jgi:hypothetical protein
MEKYYRIKKEHAVRAGLDSTLRTEDGEDLLLSEKDIRMISLTIEERVSALGGVEYVEPSEPDSSEPEATDPEATTPEEPVEEPVEEIIDPEITDPEEPVEEAVDPDSTEPDTDPDITEPEPEIIE